ncbi:MAG: hypothetical protein M4579_000183 [Chaenotheca gracillima]|nr:MAG: hypothetical protein M4579_000183 [Chaenotheca gracillima]
MVDVYVGPNKQHWRLHRELLRYVGRFFSRALSQDYREGQNSRIDFPEDDPEGFKLFVVWLYRGDLPPLINATWDGVPLMRQHLELYYFADKLCIPSLQNKAIDEIFHALRWQWVDHSARMSPDLLKDIFDHTLESSKLRWLFADYVAMDEINHRMSPQEWKALEKLLGPEFMTLLPWARAYPTGSFFDLAKDLHNTEEPTRQGQVVRSTLVRQERRMKLFETSVDHSGSSSSAFDVS